MRHEITKDITCTDSLKCSDQLRKKLENKFNIKLMRNKPSDTVDGAITIWHIPNNHKIIITTLKTKQEIEDTL